MAWTVRAKPWRRVAQAPFRRWRSFFRPLAGAAPASPTRRPAPPARFARGRPAPRAAHRPCAATARSRVASIAIPRLLTPMLPASTSSNRHACPTAAAGAATIRGVPPAPTARAGGASTSPVGRASSVSPVATPVTPSRVAPAPRVTWRTEIVIPSSEHRASSGRGPWSRPRSGAAVTRPIRRTVAARPPATRKSTSMTARIS